MASAISFVVLTSATSFNTFISVGVSDSSAGISLPAHRRGGFGRSAGADNTGLMYWWPACTLGSRRRSRDCALFRHIPVDAGVERRIEDDASLCSSAR